MGTVELIGVIGGVKYIGLRDNSGYGRSCRGYLRALAGQGIPVTWLPLRWAGMRSTRDDPAFAGLGAEFEFVGAVPDIGRAEPDAGDRDVDSLIGRLIETNTVVNHTPPVHWPVYALMDQGKRRIGLTVWETTRPPDHWKACLAHVEKVIVPSRFTREILLADGVGQPIEVIPHICPPFTGEPPAALAEIPGDRFVFYTIATWSARKAVWETLHAYLKAFSGTRESVVLVIKTDKYGTLYHRGVAVQIEVGSLIKDMVSAYQHPPEVVCITRDLSACELDGLHAAGKCFVSLTRGEGFGLGSLEAGRRGNAVVITGWGGQLEHLPADASVHIAYRLVPLTTSETFSIGCDRPGQQWAQADMDDAVDKLRWIYNNQDQAALMGERLRRYLARAYDESAVAPRLLAALQ